MRYDWCRPAFTGMCPPCVMQGKPAVRKAMVVTPSSLTQVR